MYNLNLNICCQVFTMIKYFFAIYLNKVAKQIKKKQKIKHIKDALSITTQHVSMWIKGINNTTKTKQQHQSQHMCYDLLDIQKALGYLQQSVMDFQRKVSSLVQMNIFVSNEKNSILFTNVLCN